MASPRIDRRDFLKQSAATVAIASGNGSMTNAQASRTLRQFTSYQLRRRRELWKLPGELPWDHKSKAPKLIKKERGEGYTLEHLELDLNGLEPVPALLLIPDQREESAPGLLYIHLMPLYQKYGKNEDCRISTGNFLGRPVQSFIRRR